MAVRVLTDSTAGLPADLVEAHRILVVPLTVTAGARSGPEGDEVTTADVETALRNKLEVRTAHPGPAVFAAAIDGAGDDEVVAIHLSAKLSGTWSAAETAIGDRGQVIDSQTCGMALGFVVLAAARAAAAGRTVEQVADAARHAMRRTHIWFFVESLEALRRGGRIGAASALLGSALSMKPLLHMVDGAVEPLEKVRTSSRAIARLQALAADRAGRGSVDVAVMHLAAAERAEALGEALRSSLPKVGEVHVTELSATVGAHTGLGALGLAISEGR